MSEDLKSCPRCGTEIERLKGELAEACHSEAEAATRLQEVYDLNADLRRRIETRPTRSMSDITCPKCGERFTLRYDPPDGMHETLKLYGCESAGIYKVLIQCPHCKHYEQVED